MRTDRSSLRGCRVPRHFAQQSIRGRYLIRLAIGVALSLSLKSGMADETIAPTVHPLDCAYQSPAQVQASLRAAVLAGEIQDHCRPLPRAGSHPTRAAAEVHRR